MRRKQEKIDKQKTEANKIPIKKYFSCFFNG